MACYYKQLKCNANNLREQKPFSYPSTSCRIILIFTETYKTPPEGLGPVIPARLPWPSLLESYCSLALVIHSQAVSTELVASVPLSRRLSSQICTELVCLGPSVTFREAFPHLLLQLHPVLSPLFSIPCLPLLLLSLALSVLSYALWLMLIIISQKQVFYLMLTARSQMPSSVLSAQKCLLHE